MAPVGERHRQTEFDLSDEASAGSDLDLNPVDERTAGVGGGDDLRAVDGDLQVEVVELVLGHHQYGDVLLLGRGERVLLRIADQNEAG